MLAPPLLFRRCPSNDRVSAAVVRCAFACCLLCRGRTLGACGGRTAGGGTGVSGGVAGGYTPPQNAYAGAGLPDEVPPSARPGDVVLAGVRACGCS